VVVGIRRDAASKELLTWVLVKVANAGDRVAALHVAAAADGAYPRLSHIPSADLFSPSISTKSEAIVLFGFCMFLRERRAMLETFSPSVPSSIALRKLILSFFSVSLSSFRIADGNR
jgi:hypothetical protein